MQCGNNILPRTWSTEAVAGSDDCPPSPAVSPVSPVPTKRVSFDGTIKLHRYMVDSHMKPTKEVTAVRKAARAVRIVARATRKAARAARETRATRMITPTRV